MKKLLLLFLSFVINTSTISSMEKPEINTPENHKQLLTAIRTPNIDEARTLLQAGFDPNYVNPTDPTNPLIEAINFSNADMVQLLLEHGANPNAVEATKTRDTALIKAISANPSFRFYGSNEDPAPLQKRIIRMLLAAPTLDINQSNASGHTPLMVAINLRPAFINSILNAKGIDVNKQNKSGHTAVMVVVRNKQEVDEVIQLLNVIFSHKDLNLNINLTDNSKLTALDYARSRRSKKIENLLIEHGATAANPQPAKKPRVAKAPPQAAQPASALPTPPAAQATPIRTPDQQLFAAAWNNEPAAVQAAFASGANPNALTTGKFKGRPYFFMAMDKPAIVNLFLAHAAFDPNTPDYFWDREPALSEAIRRGNFETAKALINDKRTNLNLKDGKDKTPLDYALTKGNKEIINLLISKGARANKYQAPPPPAPAVKPEPMVGETFIPEVYAALGLQPNTRDAYAILNLKADSSDVAIKKRYKELTF